jgi:hypothetical protein
MISSATKQAPAEQLEFASIAFPKDRTVLYVAEVAPLWRVSEQHIIDLLEEGKLEGFDIAGRLDYMRIPKIAIARLATLFKVKEAAILEVITEAKAERIKPPRAHWRIPREGYSKFLAENHSLAK